jgi:hypothetical protein
MQANPTHFVVTARRSTISAAMAVALVAASPASGEIGQSADIVLLRQLSADWWQWALSIPAEVNPLSFNEPESSAAHCGIGQHGKVWFLGGSFTGGPAKRRCRIPAGTAIFFPVFNVECSVIQDDGITEVELRACTNALMDTVTGLEAEVDGTPVQHVRVTSESFAFTSPPGDINGIFGAEPNPSPAVTDGFWVHLEPLDAGTHTIAFRGQGNLPNAFVFRIDVVYTVEVIPIAVD